MSIKIHKNNIKWSILFFLLLFIMGFENWTEIEILKTLFRHIDEVVVMFLSGYVFLNMPLLYKEKRSIILCWCGIFVIGFISNVVFSYQYIVPTFIDAFFIANRFMVGYFAAYAYCRRINYRMADVALFSAKVITIVLFVFSVHDIVMSPFFPKSDFRYFMYSLQLMFPHPTYLSAAAATLLIYIGYNNKRNSCIMYMLMATFVGMTTLRIKAIGFFAIYWLIYMCVFVFGIRRYLFLIGAGGLTAAFIGREQISWYYVNTGFSPRSILLKDSVNLALEHFPVGTGFGTFGSTIAAQYYSILYKQLGYMEFRGMSDTDSMFLTDNFWPIIIAQFGFFGTVIFCLVVWKLVKTSILTKKMNKKSSFTMLMILINVLINSTAESAFFNPTSLLLFIIFAVCEIEANKEYKQGLSNLGKEN